jgi:transmembrane sensor
LEKNKKIELLFERYLANQCTPEEVRRLIANFGAPEDEETLRILVSRQLSSTPQESDGLAPAVDEVYNRLMKKLIFRKDATLAPQQQGTDRRFTFPVWSRVAAVWLALLMTAGAAVYFFIKPGNRLEETAGQMVTPVHTEQTATGERRRIVLEDGSVVWLNARSKLTYPVSFRKNVREVGLEGEGYFEIFRDTGRPFIVRSGKISTKVLGTSFNIKAYAEDPTVAVAVLTGKVQINSTESTIQISPNQQISYNIENGNISKQDRIDARAQASWKDGKIQFRNTLLADVVKTLQRNYKVQIAYHNRLANCPVHADFDAETPVGRVLEMLSVSLGGKVSQRGESQYYLDGTCLQP